MGTFNFEAVGVFARTSQLESVGKRRKDFGCSDEDFISKHSDGKRVYEYSFASVPVELIPEPNNPYDPNAIAVIASGEKIGYVPRELCKTVSELISCEYSVRAKIGGGASKKVVHSNGEVRVRIEQYEYTVHIFIDSQADIAPKSTPKQSRKSKWVALVLCVFLGFLGVHYFYLGRKWKGILYLCTCGLIYIGWVYDIYAIAVGKLVDGKGRKLV